MFGGGGLVTCNAKKKAHSAVGEGWWGMVVAVRSGGTTSLLSTTTYPVLKLFLCPHIPKPEDDIVLRNDGNRSLRRGPDAHTVLDWTPPEP